MLILWLKTLHLVAMVCWFAGLFYLPRLFVYHAMSEDKISIERFKIMEGKLFYGIMTPSMIATFIFGVAMLFVGAWTMYATAGWLHIKLLLVILLAIYHYYCWEWLRSFKNDCNQHSHIFYRWMNELPVLALVVIIGLAIIKPF
jgi:putative membrane protein